MSNPLYQTRGPFHADQIRPGDPYELSNGHAIHCMGTGGRGADATAVGAAVLKSDPDVREAGVDAGYTPDSGTLRAPDVSVGNVPKKPGWVQGAPPLAVEYADTGQNEDDLSTKIADLLGSGTRWIWVVRLTGPRRVEVHAPDQKMRVLHPGDELEAPGILRNPVPVEALYDWEAGRRVTLRNLLQAEGYENLDEIRNEGKKEGEAVGRAEGRAHALLAIFEVRDLEVDAAGRERILACRDLDLLEDWLRKAMKVDRVQELFID